MQRQVRACRLLAKWCGPCRRENPNVVKAYNEFKAKGFEVLGVSLDRSKKTGWELSHRTALFGHRFPI
ncbi:MAG: TlpA disulfide reductase family protein [Bacteroidota bacterium]